MKKTTFERHSESDTLAHRQLILDSASGTHRFFRMSGVIMQRRFAELIDHADIPKILIHGNPHLANYCKTRRGAAMVDFDRSRIGPYAYDIVRFLISVSLARTSQNESLLHPIIVDHFRRGYVHGGQSADATFEEMRSLRLKAPKVWQTSTNDYLDAGKKWARRLQANKGKIKKRHTKMLVNYLDNRDELNLLDRHQLKACAEVPGSMGKLHYLYLLQDRKDKRDALLIDIKEVYDEPDNKWYHNPFDHHGIRMNTAGEIYAPGWEQRPGHATYKSEQFWARQIPTQQVKLSSPLSELDQCDLCYSVGTQLGSGQARAANKEMRQLISHDFKTNYPQYIKAANAMRKELLTSHQNYCRQVLEKDLLKTAQ